MKIKVSNRPSTRRPTTCSGHQGDAATPGTHAHPKDAPFVTLLVAAAVLLLIALGLACWDGFLYS